MEKYCLFALFQLKTDTGDRYQETISLEAECGDIHEAENLLNQKISEKLSVFSTLGLNWKIMENNVRIGPLDVGSYPGKEIDEREVMNLFS